MGKTNIYNDKHTGVFVRCIKFHLPLFIRCLSIIERSGFNFVGDKGINKKKTLNLLEVRARMKFLCEVRSGWLILCPYWF